MNAKETNIHNALKAIYAVYSNGSRKPTSVVFRKYKLHTNYAKILRSKGLIIDSEFNIKIWEGDKPTEELTLELISSHAGYSSGYQKRIQSGIKSEIKELSRKLDLILNHLNIPY